MLIWDKTLYDALYSVRAWEHGVRDFPRIPRHHYSWFVQQPRILRTKNVITNLLAQPGFSQVSDLCIVGGGMGWTTELLVAAGINVINVDTSPYVSGNWQTSEETEIRAWLTADGFDPDNLPAFADPVDPNADVVDIWAHWLHPSGGRVGLDGTRMVFEDISTSAGRRAVRRDYALPNNIDAIMTELALDGFDQADGDGPVINFVANVDALRPNPACQVVHIIEHNPFDVLMINKTLADWKAWLTLNGFSGHFVADTSGNWL